jgi:hypothetical protein
MKAKEFITNEMKQRLDAKCWKGKHKEGTKIKGGIRVNNCVPNEAMMPDSSFTGSKKNKLGPAGQWKNTGPSKNRPAKAGDLVGGGALESVNPAQQAAIAIAKKKKASVKEGCSFCGGHDHTSIDESGKASRALCTSGRPDADLGASNLASCKSQGLRARDGEKSHLIGHGNSSVRITVGGKKIKGKKYGGPLPDYGTRKGQ